MTDLTPDPELEALLKKVGVDDPSAADTVEKIVANGGPDFEAAVQAKLEQFRDHDFNERVDLEARTRYAAELEAAKPDHELDASLRRISEGGK